MQSATLIMCCAMPDALAYAKKANERGERVIATSSLKYDESAQYYTHWEWLPSVYDVDFCTALDRLAKLHHITRIFCPHNIAHYSLLELQKQDKLHIPLVGKPPIEEQTEYMQNLLNEATQMQHFIQTIACEEPLAQHIIAAILKQTEATFGESNPSKLAAMMAIFGTLPKGDVVEVGSWWGKTAVALAMLAQHYETGAVLCVDPWSTDVAIQKDSPALMQTMPGITDGKQCLADLLYIHLVWLRTDDSIICAFLL